MKTKISFMLLASVLTTGSFIFSSCNNDGAEVPEIATEPEVVNPIQQLSSVSAQLEQELSAISFDEVEPLTRALNEGSNCDCGCDCCNGDDNNDGNECDHKKFTKILKELLNHMNADFSKTKPFLRTYAFEDVIKTLKLTWTATGVNGYGRQDGKGYIKGIDALAFECNYTTDKGTYNVRVTKSVNGNVTDGVAKGITSRKLVIEKDGKDVLSIEVMNNVNEQKVLPFLPTQSIEHTGTIKVKGFIVTLGHNHKDAHTAILSLTIQREGEISPVAVMTSTVTDNLSLINMIKHDVNFASDYSVSILNGAADIKGEIKSLNALIAQSVLLTAIYKVGASEEVCKEAAAKFNENVKIRLMLTGNDIGEVTLMPVFQEELNKYSVAMFINSPLFGDEPVDVSSLLSSLGFSFEDILGMIKG